MKVEQELRLDRNEMSTIILVSLILKYIEKKRRKLLALELVSLVIKSGRLRWLGHVE